MEKEFHENSYGYRPNKNAHQALQAVRENVWKADWVLDMDIRDFFNKVSHDLLNKALSRHVEESWVKLYINRWLNCPIQKIDGTFEYRNGAGTPQGGVISPLLSNLYLHYVLDKWMDKHHPGVKFVRYADDVIVHCSTKHEAEQILESIRARMIACKLELNEEKTNLVFCKKYNKKSKHSEVSFDFLGYRFQPRPTSSKRGMFLGYDCAISKKSTSRILLTIKSTNFQRWTGRTIEEIAEYFNAKLRGWLNYFGKFRRRNLNRIFKIFNARLTNWVRNRYKKLKKSYIKHVIG